MGINNGESETCADHFRLWLIECGVFFDIVVIIVGLALAIITVCFAFKKVNGKEKVYIYMAVLAAILYLTHAFVNYDAHKYKFDCACPSCHWTSK